MAVPYFTTSHKWHNSRKKVNEHKNFYFSRAVVGNIFKAEFGEILFWSDFNETNFVDRFEKNTQKHQIM
jgi:hypothetical protein